MRKRERADPTDMASYNDLNDQVEALRANIDYIHENIQECQDNIMSMEESKVCVYLLIFTYSPILNVQESVLYMLYSVTREDVEEIAKVLDSFVLSYFIRHQSSFMPGPWICMTADCEAMAPEIEAPGFCVTYWVFGVWCLPNCYLNHIP